MIAFNNLHVLTWKHGELYIHHFWLLLFIVLLIASVLSPVTRVEVGNKDD